MNIIHLSALLDFNNKHPTATYIFNDKKIYPVFSGFLYFYDTCIIIYYVKTNEYELCANPLLRSI